MRRVLGPPRTESLLRTYGDLRSALTYSLSAEGQRSAREIRALRNAYGGQRAFIIGNGPSLRDMDLTPLRDEITFGLNRIYLLFDRMGFSTTFLVSVNPLVIEQCANELAAADARKFFSWGPRRHLTRTDDITFVRSVSKAEFSSDPSRGVWEGATVTFVAMQLAYYFGFSEVILIGVDHQFAVSGPAHETIVSQGDDASHFDPNYFGKGFRWQLPDLETSEHAYRLARQAYEADGRRVVNATAGGQLEVFPRRDYATILKAS
jgi:hypothetical protein